MTAPVPAAIPGRIDRARLDAASFPDSISMPVRFDDLDVQWHVNNAAVVVMLQEARVLFGINLALPHLHDLGLRSVVVAMNVEYAAEINHPGPVEISSGILRLGTTSFTFAQVIRQNGVGCVYATVTLAITGDSGAVPPPAIWRQAHEARAMIA